MSKTRAFLQEHLTSFRTILITFLLLIFIGACLLSLPISSSQHISTNFMDALFTASSASCVTGLILFDTVSYWSPFGQFIILLMIQIGGLGVITFSIATLMLTGKRIGIMERSTMQDSISAPQIGGIVRLTRFIFFSTFLIEGIGAFLLSFVFIKDFGVLKGIWYSIFHSISAFCNAGFDLMGIQGSNTSLMLYSNNTLISIVIPLLIIIGGIGFFTWRDLIDNHFHFKSLRLQTKIILSSTILLIVLPFMYFFFLEFTSLSLKERFLTSFFQAVTPRTAGFSTVNYQEMSETSLLLTILLMLIGGAPGSTAGGIKVTSLFVLCMFTTSFMKQKESVNCYGRRIEEKTVNNAIAILMVYLVFLLMSSFVIAGIENLDLLPVLFECASALGTVGLSMGITSSLSVISKIVLISLMWFGRIGVLTIAYATLGVKNKVSSKLPTEKVIVG